MKLRSITVENVRRFASPARIEGIGDGLNVLSAPNEHGKSTLFDAMQALFFKPHASRDRDVKALQPHAGGAPEVTVEIETEEGAFTITKRWLSKPSATIMQGGRLVAQADAAEAWISRCLGGPDGGPCGLLWVRQGLTALAGGSAKDEKAALEARRDLMSSVGHEVEAMTGGRRMDQALSRCRDELGRYATGTGRPRTGGPWKAAQDRVETLSADRDALAATATALHEALDARRRARRELDEVDRPEAAAERAAKLAQAAEAHAAAQRHAETVEAALRKVDAARIDVSRAQERLETWRTALAEQAAAQEAVVASRDEVERAASELDAAQAALDAAEEALEIAEERRATAERRRRDAERRQAAAAGAARRHDLSERIAQAEIARRKMEDAAAGAGQGPDARAIQRLESLSSDLASAVAARAATATQVSMTYTPGRDGAVRIAGRPLPEGEAVAVPHRTRIEIEGVGTLDLRPASGGDGEAGIRAAETALKTALDALGCADLAAARDAAAARVGAERRHGEAKAVFSSLAPDGLDPLRTAHAAIPEPVEDGGEEEWLDLAAADAALELAEDARITARAVRDAGAERLSETRTAMACGDAAANGAEERHRRATEALDRLGSRDEAALEAEFDRARGALDAAEALHAETARHAPDLAAAEAALARASSVDREAREAVARLKPDLARLDERISRGAGEAVEERLAETGERLTAAQADLARIEHEVAVLVRLEAALDAAKAQARDRYFAPVATELRPLLRLLWTEAELVWEQETLLPTALTRDGTPEPISILSGGTQEQVALLVRLAFARMLAKSGRHAPVILDDALVFTDDDRIERMFDALHRQAGDLQILVLSCRQRAFRDLGGRALRLTTQTGGMT